MYRGRLWTMRQFAGFGTAAETNRRFRYLLEHGQTGLSTAFDMPSLMGHDSDHPRSLGEVGREGVAIDTLADMETLFDGIPLDEVSVSMTINAPAAIMLAFYVVAAERQGVPADRLGGTIQTDILKEYIAQKEWCFPIDPAMRLVADMIEWCAHHMPRWHPISISGYHIREAGSTAAQELAFTLKDGLTYVEHAVARGSTSTTSRRGCSFFFNAHIDFFEEIAKYRAARRIWARELRDTFGARDGALAADALPHPDGRRLADRPAAAQQHRAHRDRGAGRRARRHAVAAHQLLRRGAGAPDRASGPGRAAHPADHRRGDRGDQHDRSAGGLVLRRGADRRDGGTGLRLLRQDRRARRHGRGGQARLPQREIADAAFRYQQEIERASARSWASTPTPRATTTRRRSCGSTPSSSAQMERVRGGTGARATAPRRTRRSRRSERGPRTRGANLMPQLLEAARAEATEGEIVQALQQVFGTYPEAPAF